METSKQQPCCFITMSDPYFCRAFHGLLQFYFTMFLQFFLSHANIDEKTVIMTDEQNDRTLLHFQITTFHANYYYIEVFLQYNICVFILIYAFFYSLVMSCNFGSLLYSQIYVNHICLQDQIDAFQRILTQDLDALMQLCGFFLSKYKPYEVKKRKLVENINHSFMNY